MTATRPPLQKTRLSRETSPYLLQHQHNPVHWWPWGPDALAEAKRTNKPILLSVGYAAWHWCHVMAHESFEDEATAAAMNELFVSIKVDHEERPDIDQIYMNALHLLGGQGGWPLTMFLAPDGSPFWGGTYFPKTSQYGRVAFTDVLRDGRATLGVPLLREATPIGALALQRTEPRAYSPKQIELVETFAAQAVIAIENTQLLKELRQRTEDLGESLQQQTATSDVLRSEER